MIFGERDIAEVFDDYGVEASFGEGKRITPGPVDDRAEPGGGAAARRTGQRGEMDCANEVGMRHGLTTRPRGRDARHDRAGGEDQHQDREQSEAAPGPDRLLIFRDVTLAE